MFTPEDMAALLDAAQTALRDDLLKALPAEHRHTGLMVASAMAMARRYLLMPVAMAAEGAEPPIRSALLAQCRQELQITNPKRL